MSEQKKVLKKRKPRSKCGATGTQPPLVEALLRLQFKSVGETYSHEFTQQDNWYMLRTWTPKQYGWFKERAMKVLQKSGLSKPAAETQLAWWHLQYGWTGA